MTSNDWNLSEREAEVELTRSHPPDFKMWQRRDGLRQRQPAMKEDNVILLSPLSNLWLFQWRQRRRETRKAVVEHRPPTSMYSYSVTKRCSKAVVIQDYVFRLLYDWSLGFWSWSLDNHMSKSLHNPEHSQNVIICFLAHYEHFLKILSRSVNNASNFVQTQTGTASFYVTLVKVIAAGLQGLKKKVINGLESVASCQLEK